MRYSTIQKQRGLSLSGLLLWSAVLVVGAVLAMKVVPAYTEFALIKKALGAVAKSPESQNSSISQLRAAFDRQATIDNIHVISGKDIEANLEAGQPVLAVSYVVKIPLVANISLSIDFSAASNK
jgi:Domain of unknown function (DUF4845)